MIELNSRIAEIKYKIKHDGPQQYNEDTDARNNLVFQMHRLQSYLAVLMKKVPIIRLVVNKADKKGKNPEQ